MTRKMLVPGLSLAVLEAGDADDVAAVSRKDSEHFGGDPCPVPQRRPEEGSMARRQRASRWTKRGVVVPVSQRLTVLCGTFSSPANFHFVSIPSSARNSLTQAEKTGSLSRFSRPSESVSAVASRTA